MKRTSLFMAIAAGTLLFSAAQAQDTTTRDDHAVTRTTVPSPDQRPSQQTGQTGQMGQTGEMGQTPRATDTASQRAQTAAAGAQASQLNAADRRFLDEAIQSSNAEVVLGQLAEQRASSSEVKEFGRKMQQDHSQANRDLQALHAGRAAGTATAAQATAPRADESKLSAEQRRVAEELRGLDGPRFDAAYAQHMVKMHEKDIERFEKAANDDKHSPAVRQAAQRKLETLRDHLESAESLEQRTAALDD
jgi:putative membrane protein